MSGAIEAVKHVSKDLGWEDLIIVENLENSISKLRKELSNVRNIYIS